MQPILMRPAWSARLSAPGCALFEAFRDGNRIQEEKMQLRNCGAADYIRPAERSITWLSFSILLESDTNDGFVR